MAVATQMCSVPRLLACPAGKGMPQEDREGDKRRNRLREWGKTGTGLNEGRESSKVGGVPGALSSAMSGGPTVQWNENGSVHLSKPWRGLRQWESLSRILLSPLPSILLQAAPEIYLAVRQERQCKSNPPPINYLFYSPFSSFSPSLHRLPHSPPFCLLPPHPPPPLPPCPAPLNMQLPIAI